MPSNWLYQLIAGRCAMAADTVLRLEQWLGVEAGFWLNVQKTYELDRAIKQTGEEIKRTVCRREPLLSQPAARQHKAYIRICQADEDIPPG